MKYYEELINLEETLIEFGGIKAIARALAIAVNQMPAKDREEALWSFANLLDTHDKDFNETFYALFEKVKNETQKKGSKNV